MARRALVVNDSSNVRALNVQLEVIDGATQNLTDAGTLPFASLIPPVDVANRVYATPDVATATKGPAKFRALTASDIPAIPDAKLSSNVALLDRNSQTFTGTPQIINASVAIGSASAPTANSKLDLTGALRLGGVTYPTTDPGAWIVNETSVGLAIQSGGTLRLRTNASATDKLTIDANGNVSLPLQALTAGALTLTNSAFSNKVTHRFDWTNAMIVALGASLTGDITICTLPAKTVVTNAYLVIDTPDASANALSVAVGRVAATYADYLVASDAKAVANTVYGDAAAERGTNLTGYDLPSYTGTTAVKMHLIKAVTNLSTVAGSTGHIYLETMVLP